MSIPLTIPLIDSQSFYIHFMSLTSGAFHHTSGLENLI